LKKSKKSDRNTEYWYINKNEIVFKFIWFRLS
jgi:hypothetical protein